MNLYEKLVEIRKTVPYIKKDARNAFFQYDYVSSVSVISAVREKMDEMGVLLVPRIVEHEAIMETTKNRKGDDQHNIFTKLKIVYTWINAEKPDETICVEWAAQGIDSSERGIGKALTYAEKNFLLRFFQVPTPKDDPDASPEVQEPSRSTRPRTQPKQPSSVKKVKVFKLDTTRPGWENTKVGIDELGELTWRQLADDIALLDGSSGRYYLQRLADWKERQDVAIVAQKALEGFGGKQSKPEQKPQAKEKPQEESQTEKPSILVREQKTIPEDWLPKQMQGKDQHITFKLGATDSRIRFQNSKGVWNSLRQFMHYNWIEGEKKAAHDELADRYPSGGLTDDEAANIMRESLKEQEKLTDQKKGV